ncbi:MAG TPA: methyl-accepting chemotaxis protein [Candidatus Omnitrophota bacterium]|nr:methyl-accepting chemotaxis protein [Candidatus Omnitrophota bacterium]
MSWVLLVLLIISTTLIFALHFGIWGYALKEFSDESVRNALKMTSRLNDYEIARYQPAGEVTLPKLALLRETELFSSRQREILQGILSETQKRTIFLGIPLLFFIGWGSIFISHKIAGPLYHFNRIFKELKAKNLTARVRLRKYDEGKKIAETFNEAVLELDRSVAKMKKAAREAGEGVKLPNALTEELSQFKTTQN